jgi:hypothetical protein
MKIKLFFFLTSLTLFISCSAFQNRKPSSQSDEYWAKMVKESETNHQSIIEIIKNDNRPLYQQIHNDTQDPLLLTFWGQSLNFDSGAKKQIISDLINTDLHAQFALTTNNYVVHAGVTHTYGYLFSILETPYGFKRKRWTAPTLNGAFSLENLSLSPETVEGTLLSNVTYFMGMLAFKNDSDRVLLKNLKNVSPEIRNFNYYSLTVEHLEEILPRFTLRTTFLKFPKRLAGEENDYLLIYSIMDQTLHKEFLITAFPVKKEAYQKTIAPEELGVNRPVTIRYNAYLEGLMDQPWRGTKVFWKEAR